MELEAKALQTPATPARTPANPARTPVNAAYSTEKTPTSSLSSRAASSHTSKAQLVEAHLSECLEESRTPLEPHEGGVLFSSEKSQGC
jgi:hypothetical protein